MFLDELAEEYETLCFDWLGMGCSSKPDIDYIKLTSQQVIDLFTECLRKWILESGCTNFHLVAHSLGAYIASFYLSRPESAQIEFRVDGICLLTETSLLHFNKDLSSDSACSSILSFITVSCAGAVPEPANFSTVLKELKLPIMRKAMMHFWIFMNKGYIRGHTAFSLMPLEWIISKWAKGRLGVEGEAYSKVVKFISTMFWDKNYSSDIITRIFTYKAYGIQPACDLMPAIESKVPVLHVYGEQDWLDRAAFASFLQRSRFCVNCKAN